VSRKRALYLARERVDPPTSGGRLHGAGMLAGLREHMDVVLLSPDETDSRFPSWSQAIERLRGRRASQVRRAVDTARGLAAGRHIVLERSERAGLPKALADVLRVVEPDLVVLGRPFFGTFIDVARGSGAAVVVDADESLVRVARSVAASRAPWSKRLRAIFDLATVGRMERREYPRVDQVWVISGVERQHFIHYLAPERVVETPHVLPLDQWTHGRTSATRIEPPADVNAVAYVGWYGYPPNEAAALELANEIMPRVRALGGPKRLVLIGRDPTPRMWRLTRDSNVVVTGEVADVIPPMRAAGLLAVPLRSGGGVRVKILEAAAAGVPVVSTRFGIEGLGLASGDGVLVADEWDDFARAIVRLAADGDLRSAMATRARALLMETHSPASLADALGRALASLGLR
jgi:glycosyltransferase involved in cell wall biosynthesis